MKVKYVGAAKDYSGYGEAARHDIASLLSAGIQVTGLYPSYVPEISDFGALGEAVNEVENREIAYETIILHTTPNVYKKYMEPGKYHIARVFWETDRLPDDFAQNVELCQEVWTGSEYNRQAIIASGVTKPIYIIPQALAEMNSESIQPYKTTIENKYIFYSIFEWTQRKNPEALLRAYWDEFTKEDNVALVIKTYLDNFSKTKYEEIDQYIRILKKRLGKDYYAPVYLYRKLMDRQQIYRFHKTFNSFVSAHRGEGWGIPQVEALSMGKTLISTNLGGVHEYLQNGVDALLLDYVLIPLKENNRNAHWYTQNQRWGEVEITGLRWAMREVYSDKALAERMAAHGKQTIQEKFSFAVVGKTMRERLLTIDSEILHPIPEGAIA